jgi:hypothetical protein
MRPTLLAACLMLIAGAPASALAQTPAAAFFDKLSALCGKSFAGKVVAGDATDDAFRAAELVMTVQSCTAEEIRIPFRVGEDRSRTWVVTRLGEDRLRLKHDHRHADGVEDEISRYGGDTLDPGTAERQSFPADAESIALFTRTGRSVSNTNVWSLELDGRQFVYELARPNRLFRVAFDLETPAGAQPPS